MIKKYNIAFIPQSKNNDIVKLTSVFNVNFGEYRLGKNSYSHVTLSHFYMDDSKIGETWFNILSLFDKTKVRLNFYKYSHLTFDGRIFWISLLPDNQFFLNKMHLEICDLLQIKSKSIFDPHMTLFCTDKKVPEDNMPALSMHQAIIEDDFILSLGECDNIGQLTKIIFPSNP